MVKWRVKLFFLFLSIRIAMAVISLTWYVPDETWQSVEIAHGLVWKDRAFKTWEWEHGLRSYLHPLLFVPVFQLLNVLRLDTPYLVGLCPRLVQAVLTSVGDVANVVVFDRHFAKRQQRSSDNWWFVFVYATNW